MTRRPATTLGSSTVTGLSARSTVARGLSSRTEASTALDVGRPRRVALGDDDDVSHPDVGLAGVVCRLVAGAQRVGQHDVQVGHVERQVVVAAVPEDDVGLLLGLRRIRS